MHPAVRVVIAVICGALIAFALVAGIEAVGARVFPAPAGIDAAQPAQWQTSIPKLPLGALLIVLAAWIVSTFVGAVAASLIARRRVRLVSAIVGILVLASTVANFVLIPHPLWMVFCGVAGIIIAALLAGKLMARRRAASEQGPITL
jgi:hypothetical protein